VVLLAASTVLLQQLPVAVMLPAAAHLLPNHIDTPFITGIQLHDTRLHQLWAIQLAGYG
jgi:hypothetical protein